MTKPSATSEARLSLWRFALIYIGLKIAHAVLVLVSALYPLASITLYAIGSFVYLPMAAAMLEGGRVTRRIGHARSGSALWRDSRRAVWIVLGFELALAASTYWAMGVRIPDLYLDTLALSVLAFLAVVVALGAFLSVRVGLGIAQRSYLKRHPATQTPDDQAEA